MRDFDKNVFKPIKENPIIMDFSGVQYLGEIHLLFLNIYSAAQLQESTFLQFGENQEETDVLEFSKMLKKTLAFSEKYDTIKAQSCSRE